MTLLSRLAFVLCLLCLLAPAGCAGKKDAKTADGEPVVEKQEPVETLYNRAALKMDEGNFVEAANLFDEVDRQYPYSQWAARAQLMSGYAQYKRLKYDEALLALDRFIELHPGDENVAYAWYLKALCSYEQISDVRRDQKMTEEALAALRQVVERFPDSRYAKDAALKIDLTLDHLAGKEMEIGRYYLSQQQYQAAVNRFERVVTQYQTTTHLPEALHRMTECYLAMGMTEEAKRTAAILGHNYPGSSWYQDTYRLMGGNVEKAPEKSLYDKTLGKIL